MAECVVNNKNLIPYEDSRTFDRFEYKQATLIGDGTGKIDFRELNLISQRWYFINVGTSCRRLRLVYGESAPAHRIWFCYLTVPSNLGSGIGLGDFVCLGFSDASHEFSYSDSADKIIAFYYMDS